MPNYFMPSKRHIEQEFKLTAPRQHTLDDILGSALFLSHLGAAQGLQTAGLHAFYYDTQDWLLREKRWSFRTRQEDATFVAALKRKSTIVNGLLTCEETEQTLDGHIQTISDLPKGDILDALKAHISYKAPLVARVEIKMLRRKALLEFDGAQVEFVADAGEIHANGQSQALFEIEIELKKGSFNASILKFIETLALSFSLKPSTHSKHQIGLLMY